MEDFIAVVALQDDDGHWYIVPVEEEEAFRTWLAHGYERDDWSVFNQHYIQYATGGDLNLVQLYIKKE